MPLADVLDDPVVRCGDPVVLAGTDGLDRAVRWVHSSDIYEIAPLLRHGDLLLTTGLGLEDRPPEEIRHYVRQLAARGVSGLALEVCRFFFSAPPEMIDEAQRVGLPLIGLRSVVPFVEVTEAVNGAIVEAAVHRLRHADEVSRALSEVLVAGGGVDEVLCRLDGLLPGPVAFTRAVPGEGHQPIDDVDEVPVIAGGAIIGWLRTRLTEHARLLGEAALERAASALSLAVLRDERVTTTELATRRHLAALLVRGDGDVAALRAAVGSAGLPIVESSYVAVLAAGPDVADTLAALDRSGRAVAGTARMVSATTGQEPPVAGLLAGLASPRALAATLTGCLRREAARMPHLLAAVGPGVSSLEDVQRSALHARLALRAVWAVAPKSRVVDSATSGVEQVLLRGHEQHQLAEFVTDQLGPVLEYDTTRGTRLLETLRAVLESVDGKAEAARRLHIQRQTLYQRLARIERLLRVPLADGGVRAGLVVALRAHQLIAATQPDWSTSSATVTRATERSG